MLQPGPWAQIVFESAYSASQGPLIASVDTILYRPSPLKLRSEKRAPRPVPGRKTL